MCLFCVFPRRNPLLIHRPWSQSPDGRRTNLLFLSIALKVLPKRLVIGRHFTKEQHSGAMTLILYVSILVTV